MDITRLSARAACIKKSGLTEMGQACTLSMPMSTAEITPTIDLAIDNSPVTPTGSPKVSPISMKRNDRITPGEVVAKRLKTKAERNNLPTKPFSPV